MHRCWVRRTRRPRALANSSVSPLVPEAQGASRLHGAAGADVTGTCRGEAMPRPPSIMPMWLCSFPIICKTGPRDTATSRRPTEGPSGCASAARSGWASTSRRCAPGDRTAWTCSSCAVCRTSISALPRKRRPRTNPVGVGARPCLARRQSCRCGYVRSISSARPDQGTLLPRDARRKAHRGVHRRRVPAGRALLGAAHLGTGQRGPARAVRCAGRRFPRFRGSGGREPTLSV